MSKTFIVDLLERVFWTALQATVGVLSAVQWDLDEFWIVVIAFGLSVLKGVIAKNIGNPDSASTAPSVPPIDQPAPEA
jgi:hypothetical protein